MGYDDAVRLALAERERAASGDAAGEDAERRSRPAGTQPRVAPEARHDAAGDDGTWPSSRLVQLLRPALIDKVERDHRQPDSAFLRRRVVVGVVLVVGATLLGISLSVPPGSPAFYPLTLALAAIWVIGGLASGPLHLGPDPLPGHPAAAGGHADRARPAWPWPCSSSGRWSCGRSRRCATSPSTSWTTRGTGRCRWSLLITVLNGIAEEVFFRGALFAAIGARHPVLISTAVYAVATVATGNPMLVFAAATLGPGPRAAAPCLRRGAGADPDPHHLVARPWC